MHQFTLDPASIFVTQVEIEVLGCQMTISNQIGYKELPSPDGTASGLIIMYG